jgi:GR25 family glycosyltransferase involved in LPS biosynthesis
MPNKDIFKGFGPVYVINLEKRVDRREAVLKDFSDYGVFDYTFIQAIDPEKNNVYEGISTLQPMTAAEIACTLSHKKAIKYWLDNSDTDQAIIMEDDTSFDAAAYWGFTWPEFLNSLDFDYNVLQLSISLTRGPVNYELHRRDGEACASTYVIKRKYAEKIIKDDLNPIKIPVSERFIFQGPNVYTAGMFVHNKETMKVSDIRPGQERFITLLREDNLNYWKNRYNVLAQPLKEKPCQTN